MKTDREVTHPEAIASPLCLQLARSDHCISERCTSALHACTDLCTSRSTWDPPLSRVGNSKQPTLLDLFTRNSTNLILKQQLLEREQRDQQRLSLLQLQIPRAADKKMNGCHDRCSAEQYGAVCWCMLPQLGHKFTDNRGQFCLMLQN